jgi:hypothetical protein
LSRHEAIQIASLTEVNIVHDFFSLISLLEIASGA